MQALADVNVICPATAEIGRNDNVQPGMQPGMMMQQVGGSDRSIIANDAGVSASSLFSFFWVIQTVRKKTDS